MGKDKLKKADGTSPTFYVKHKMRPRNGAQKSSERNAHEAKINALLNAQRRASEIAWDETGSATVCRGKR